jgi:hypothetical protein
MVFAERLLMIHRSAHKWLLVYGLLIREHTRCEPDTLCKLFRSRPQDVPRGWGVGGYRKISLEMLVEVGYVQNTPPPLP